MGFEKKRGLRGVWVEFRGVWWSLRDGWVEFRVGE